MTTFSTSRQLQASPAAIFDAIRQGERLARWWGPAGFANRFDVFDFTVGGNWVFTMIGPDGSTYPNESVFDVIEPDRKVVIRHVNAPHFQLAITLEPAAGGTLLRWDQTFDDPAVAQAVRHIVEPANEQNLDRLASELGASQGPVKITVDATIAAPLALIWQAWTTPADITQWNAASPDWHTTRAEVDLRVGGGFSSRMEAKDGSMGFDFAGTYTQVVPQQLLACSFGERSMQVEFIQGPNGVTVRETFDSEPTHSEDQQRAGWQAILDNFARHVLSKASAPR